MKYISLGFCYNYLPPLDLIFYFYQILLYMHLFFSVCCFKAFLEVCRKNELKKQIEIFFLHVKPHLVFFGTNNLLNLSQDSKVDATFVVTLH